MGEHTVAGTTEQGDDTVAGVERVALEVLAGGAPWSLAPQLDNLLDLDLRDRPLAGLAVAAACHDVYRGDPRVAELVETAWDELLRRQDDLGLGLAANVRANVAFGRGDVDEALHWWRRCLDLLDAGVPLTGSALAHLSVDAYRRGDLQGAIQRAEEALARLQNTGDRAGSLVPLIYLVLYHLNLGDFRRAERELDAADGIWREIRTTGLRNDGPLVASLRGTLEALRGHRVAADAAFADALCTADELSAPWYTVMALSLRGEFTAAWAPERSLTDAQRAYRAAQAIGDEWWAKLSRLAEASALRELGRLDEAVDRFQQAAADLANPLERSRALVGLGETHLRAGRRVAARASLQEALELVEAGGARYWVARACVGLASAERDRGAHWVARAHTCDDGDAAYEMLSAVERLRINLAGRPSVHVGSRHARFQTRHAEAVVYLLTIAGAQGLPVGRLARALWPTAEASRRPHRLRTLLWQVRNALGPHAWRLTRDAERVVLDTVGVEITGAASTVLDGVVVSGRSLTDLIVELELSDR